MSKVEASLLDIIKESQVYREKDYIDYFFKEITSMKDKKPVFEKNEFFPNSFLSIVKDSTDRVLDNTKGKLMERSWRNTIFYFVDKGKWIDYFGTNSSYPSFEIDRKSVV